MKSIRVVGEDALCCALGEKLIADILPNWSQSHDPIISGGITKLTPNLIRYAEQARYVQPILCIADTDGECPVSLLDKWLPPNATNRFVFRFAVKEAETWVLADRQNAADFFGVAIKQVPEWPEEEVDAKGAVLRLARRSTRSRLRREMISLTDNNKIGTGYNVHLRALVLESWQPRVAAEKSASLHRAISKLIALDTASE